MMVFYVNLFILFTTACVLNCCPLVKNTTRTCCVLTCNKTRSDLTLQRKINEVEKFNWWRYFIMDNKAVFNSTQEVKKKVSSARLYLSNTLFASHLLVNNQFFFHPHTGHINISTTTNINFTRIHWKVLLEVLEAKAIETIRLRVQDSKQHLHLSNLFIFNWCKDTNKILNSSRTDCDNNCPVQFLAFNYCKKCLRK